MDNFRKSLGINQTFGLPETMMVCDCLWLITTGPVVFHQTECCIHFSRRVKLRGRGRFAANDTQTFK